MSHTLTTHSALGFTHNKIGRAPSHFSMETLFLLFVALLLRLLFAALYIRTHSVAWIFSKGVEMGYVATSILSGAGFSSPMGGYTGPTALFSPAYAFFVAAVFRLTGSYSLHSIITIVAIQIAVSLLNLWLILRIAERLAGKQAAFCVGLLWCCAPALLWMPTYTWDTTFTTCLITGTIALALEFSDHPSLRRLLWSAAYGGVVVLVNPALMLSVLAIFAWLATQLQRNRMRSALLSVVTVLAVFSPWPIRNAVAMHHFIPLRTNMGLELWMGNHEGSTGHLEVPMYPAFNAVEYAEYKRAGEYQYDRDKIHITELYISAHPATFAHLTLQRFVRFWFGTGSVESPIAASAETCLTTLLAAFGLIVLCMRRNFATLMPILLTCILYPLPYYITHAELRYRLVIDPLMLALSAVAIARALDRVALLKLRTASQQSPASLPVISVGKERLTG